MTIKNYKTSMRKLGTVSFTFFFIKGLLWLIVPLAIAWFT